MPQLQDFHLPLDLPMHVNKHPIRDPVSFMFPHEETADKGGSPTENHLNFQKTVCWMLKGCQACIVISCMYCIVQYLVQLAIDSEFCHRAFVKPSTMLKPKA
jgi:hypothetical protein